MATPCRRSSRLHGGPRPVSIPTVKKHKTGQRYSHHDGSFDLCESLTSCTNSKLLRCQNQVHHLRNQLHHLQGKCSTESSPTKLSSLVEREETPPSGSQVNIDALVSSSMATPNTAMSKRDSHVTPSLLKTPRTTSRFDPGLEEMHPSKVQQSTAKLGRLDSHLCFQMPETLRLAPEPKSASATTVQSTPTKCKGSLPKHMSSSTFDFSLALPESHLSMETQKIMDNVREEAAKIKAQMQAERDKQERRDEEASHMYGVIGRPIAKPKGKAGRYSQVHMQEFKKMDSIAGHPSTWKNKSQASQPNADSLKRSKSKVRLNAGEMDGKIRANENDRLENTAPSKRARKNYADDASAARPLSSGATAEKGTAQSIPTKPCSQFGLPSVVSTPTQASLARSASVKHLKTSIPSLPRSNSTKILACPVTPKTEGNNKCPTSLTKFGGIKPILHRHQPKLSNDLIKVAAVTHLPPPEAAVSLNKDLPSLPCTPMIDKRVDFTPTTKARYDLAAASPSPSKIPGLHLNLSDPVKYPSLPDSSNLATGISKLATTAAPASFTFRADKTLKFESAPSLGKTPTIRQVRPSGIATPMTSYEPLPPIPHGMPNKKRRRVDSDDEDTENVFTKGKAREDEDGPRAKKVKGSPQKDRSTSNKGNNDKIGGSAIPKLTPGKEKKRSVLSLSRLHMLARPKDRG